MLGVDLGLIDSHLAKSLDEDVPARTIFGTGCFSSKVEPAERLPA